jgi:uracil-DNA glycosylase
MAMPQTDRSELARQARAFFEQQAEIDDSDLWPRHDAGRVAQVRELPPVKSEERRDQDSETARPVHAPAPRATAPQPPQEPVAEMEAPPEMAQANLGPGEWEGLTLEQFGEKIAPCTRCRLHEQANNFVFGKGSPEADLMFIGEGPGEEEDRQGLPFVGRAGKLLDKMIVAMQLSLDEVYIANVVKHRPPGNRNPLEDEVAACIPFLDHQIALIKPKLICLLGRVSAQAILKSNESLGRMRGHWFEYRSAKVMVTYHPAALLRNPGWKKQAWDDLKKLRFELDGVEL